MATEFLHPANDQPRGLSTAVDNELTHRKTFNSDEAAGVPDKTEDEQSSRGDDINALSAAALRPYGRRRPVGLMSLPPEILVQISQYLIYPDALELKHTNRFFFYAVYTGVRLKVDWLMLRRALHLDCPDTRCDLGSDVRFCRGSVPLLMKHRREHIECESRPGIGCLVFDTPKCAHQKPSLVVQRWLRRSVTMEAWWVLLAIAPIILAWIWLGQLCLSGNFWRPQV